MISDFGADVFGGGDDAPPPARSKQESGRSESGSAADTGSGPQDSAEHAGEGESTPIAKKKTRRRSRKKAPSEADSETGSGVESEPSGEIELPQAPDFGDGPPATNSGDHAEASTEASGREKSRPSSRRGRRGRGRQSTEDRPERRSHRASTAPERSASGSPRGHSQGTVRGPQRIAIFLDIEKILQEASNQEGELAFSKLLPGLLGKRVLIRAVAYGSEEGIGNHAGILDRSGIELQVVPGPDALAVSIAVDAMAIAPRVDSVILVPGDESLAPLATALRSTGVRVESASFHHQEDDSIPTQSHHELGRECLFIP